MEDLVDDGNDAQSVPKILNAAHLFYDYLERHIAKLNPASADDIGSVWVEKITGSRIHIMLKNSDQSILQNLFWDIVTYAKRLLKALNEARLLPQEKSFSINMGADYGECIHWPFSYKDIYEDNSFGKPSSRGAKLQAMAPSGQLLLSTKAESVLKKESNKLFFSASAIDEAILTRVKKKYPDVTVTSFSLASLDKSISESLGEDTIKRFSQDITAFSQDKRYFSGNSQIELNNFPTRHNGFVLYADIRGSTKMVETGGLSLDIVAEKQNEQLESSVDASLSNGLEHIQIQGDRECSCLKSDEAKASESAVTAITAAFSSLPDEGSTLTIGVGIAYGTFYGRQVGRSNEKDNLVLGKTISRADEAEGDIASGDNEIAIDAQTYNLATKSSDAAFVKALKHYFHPTTDNRFFVTKASKNDFISYWNAYDDRRDDEYQRSSGGSKAWLNL